MNSLWKVSLLPSLMRDTHQFIMHMSCLKKRLTKLFIYEILCLEVIFYEGEWVETLSLFRQMNYVSSMSIEESQRPDNYSTRWLLH